MFFTQTQVNCILLASPFIDFDNMQYKFQFPSRYILHSIENSSKYFAYFSQIINFKLSDLQLQNEIIVHFTYGVFFMCKKCFMFYLFKFNNYKMFYLYMYVKL